MKRFLAMVAALAIIVGAAAAVDTYVLHPQRQALKILRYYAIADAQRIRQLEQIVAAGGLKLAPRDTLNAAEQCVSASVAAVHADFEAIPRAFAQCRSELAAHVRSWVPGASDDLLFAIYATALASQLGPYGPSSETDVRVIAQGGMLNCTQTMIFVAATLKFFRPALTVAEVALATASLGQHGLVEAQIGGRSVVLDGSTGTVYLASLGHMLSPGPKHLPAIDFFAETDTRLAALLAEMARSVHLGRLSADDVVSRREL